MGLGQVRVLGVGEEYVAQLEVGARLHPRGRLEAEHRLQALDAQLDHGRAGGAEVLRQAQQRQVPGVLGRRHRAETKDRTRGVSFNSFVCLRP